VEAAKEIMKALSELLAQYAQPTADLALAAVRVGAIGEIVQAVIVFAFGLFLLRVAAKRFRVAAEIARERGDRFRDDEEVPNFVIGGGCAFFGGVTALISGIQLLTPVMWVSAFDPLLGLAMKLVGKF